MIDRDVLKGSGSPTFDAWADANDKVDKLQNELSKLVSSATDDTTGKLVVVIDELDRCRPDYALELIESVRHLFAVEGVVVLLAINREELCHSVQNIYGSDFDSDRYLRRFVDVASHAPTTYTGAISRTSPRDLLALNFSLGPAGFSRGRTRESYVAIDAAEKLQRRYVTTSETFNRRST